MRYNRWEQRQLDQQSGFILDEQERARQEAFVSEMARLLEQVDSETLDQWEREQYNRLKLEQEARDG
jgi:hypothetical protein